MRNKVLLVEDDHLIVENLTEFLTREGFEIRSADGQQKAMELLEEHKFDLILLDITLAQGNGYSVCTAVKALYHIPIIFLTALDDEFSVVTGLDMGADDYISKPFRPRELVSRMRMVIRRFYGEKEKIQLQTGKLEIDTARGIVKKNGQEVFLTSLEYRLLLLFFQTINYFSKLFICFMVIFWQIKMSHKRDKHILQPAIIIVFKRRE